MPPKRAGLLSGTGAYVARPGRRQAAPPTEEDIQRAVLDQDDRATSKKTNLKMKEVDLTEMRKAAVKIKQGPGHLPQETLYQMITSVDGVTDPDVLSSRTERIHTFNTTFGPWISVQKRDFVYELMNLAAATSFEHAMDFVEGYAQRGKVNLNLFLKSPLWEEAAAHFKETLAIITKELQFEKGIPCKFCRGTNTRVFQIQRRRGDEGFNFEPYCYDCERKFHLR